MSRNKSGKNGQIRNSGDHEVGTGANRRRNHSLSTDHTRRKSTVKYVANESSSQLVQTSQQTAIEQGTLKLIYLVYKTVLVFVFALWLNMDGNIINVDNILWQLGIYGKYQVFQCIYMLISMIPLSYPVLIYLHIGHIPPYRCQNLTQPPSTYDVSLDNDVPYNVTYGKCEVTITQGNNDSRSPFRKSMSCPDGYHFDGASTVISEWDLVCNKQGLGEMSTSLVILGQMIGSAIFPALADKYGRHFLSYSTHIFMCAFSIGLAFVPTFPGFVVLRVIIGALQQGAGLAQATIVMEIFPTSARGIVTFMVCNVWALGISSLTLIGYLMKDYSWRYIQFTAGMLAAHSIITRWALRESFRWLIANNRIAEAKVWIRKAAKWNKLEEEKVESILNALSDTYTLNNSIDVDTNKTEVNKTTKEVILKPQTNKIDSTSVKYNFLDIVKNRTLLRNSLIIWTAWFTDSLTYYGLFLTSHFMAGDRYLNYFITSLVEVPGTVLFYLIVDRWGRKKTFAFFQGTAGLFLIVSVALLVYEDNTIAITTSTVCNFLGKMSISGCYSILFMYTLEIYPTNLRNEGLGFASAASRVGSIVSPYSAVLASYAVWGPGVIFGCLCFVVTILVYWLPETMGKELPHTIEDIVSWDNVSKTETKDEERSMMES